MDVETDLQFGLAHAEEEDALLYMQAVSSVQLVFFFFFNQKTAYEIHRCLEFRRVLFRSCGAIQGAKSAAMMQRRTIAAPATASGERRWRGRWRGALMRAARAGRPPRTGDPSRG